MAAPALIGAVAACVALNAPLDALAGDLRGFAPADVAIGVVDLGCAIVTKTFTPGLVLGVIGDGAQVAADIRKHRGR